MFSGDSLKNHLQTSDTIKIKSLITAEWNMNMPDNISKLGNYRYRPNGSEVKYRTIPLSFDINDAGNYYTNATNSDIIIDGGFTDSGIPQQFVSIDEKSKLLFSLEDCVKPFRPRSGINKCTYFSNRHISNSGARFAERPRYYMPSRYDEFRYWTSYRKESSAEYGIAKTVINGQYYIDDACPFVVYKNQVPTNRIVIKMQTNVGNVNLGPFTTSSSTKPDPFFGDTNKTTPIKWKVQYLKNNTWTDAYSFNENSVRKDGTAIIKSDGYLELEYGLIVPEEYENIFIFAETLSSSNLLPSKAISGYAYLVVSEQDSVGMFYIWTGEEYEQFLPNYGWKVSEASVDTKTGFVTDPTNPSSFLDSVSGQTKYREFEYISGIRIVVETMNKFDSTFDLIEMSPRLLVDISDKVTNYNITKNLSDMGNGPLPVGQLLVSTGTINIFDNDRAFSEINTSSILSKYLRKNVKFNFYEVVINVDGYDYYIPIKTLYSEGFPQTDYEIDITLRDFYFYLESMPAPRLLLTEASLSFAIATLLDYIGFSNYTFKRISGEHDPIIPYFFVAPDQNVAEVLNQLAVATQSAMFFDEYNNFIVMSKNYIMPSENSRGTDMILSGNNNQSVDGIIRNESSGILPNIIAISSKDKKIYNDGKINYTTRYIQRSYGSIKQSSMIDKQKTWIYKPVLLWEVSGTENTKTINEVASTQGSYVLSAMPMNSNLNANPPVVVNGVVTNNIIDFGENIYWLTRYQGYFYNNGEIIKYDAVQFDITGTGLVWITSNQQYQEYFSSLPFNGKIYPTGLVRIYSKPYYETIDNVFKLKNGAVQEHGRGQFGTTITDHYAGINSYWSNNDYVRGCTMETQYLFTTKLDGDIVVPSTTVGPAGISNVLARQTTRNSVIKNFMSLSSLTETGINSLQSTQSGTIQSSALVMNGPSFTTADNPLNFISYQYKQLNNAYKHFGTRMRVIGKIENSEIRTQTAIGTMPYLQIPGNQPNQSVNIGGASGGLAVLLNPETNNGYYFEIIAMSEDNISSYLNLDKNGNSAISINNIVFYKIKKDSSSDKAIPIKLWGGLSNILVDDGRFTGQYRMTGDENTTVYDLSVEYEDIGTTRRFYLYINNKLIKIVDDKDPLPIYNNMAPFIRGSSRCMFENIYALSKNYSQNTVFSVGETLSEAFGDKNIDANESFRKYSMSGILQATYLSGISSQQPPKYNIYFDEFGSIMRECAYFDIKYDRAYPALYANLSPTFNRIKTYTTSGFQADSYGAEFLIFNATDKALVLDETSGNYLRIQGITFTQDTTRVLSVDEYFAKRSNLANPEYTNPNGNLVRSPLVELSKYNEIKQSRVVHGKNEFSLESIYIQSQDDAEQLMDWIINKIIKPKMLIGINLFSMPILQLGDIVTIDYKDNENNDIVVSNNKRFVIYNIEHSRNENGPNMSIYLSEV